MSSPASPFLLCSHCPANPNQLKAHSYTDGRNVANLFSQRSGHNPTGLGGSTQRLSVDYSSRGRQNAFSKTHGKSSDDDYLRIQQVDKNRQRFSKTGPSGVDNSLCQLIALPVAGNSDARRYPYAGVESQTFQPGSKALGKKMSPLESGLRQQHHEFL